MDANCWHCVNFVVAPHEIESLIPGFNVVSSAYGAVRADTGYCRFNDVFLVATAPCPGFKMKLATVGMKQ